MRWGLEKLPSGWGHRDPIRGKERVCTIVEHLDSELFEDGKRLLVQVTHHSVTAPTGEEFDHVSVTSRGE